MWKTLLMIGLALTLSACLDFEQAVYLQADGSGEIHLDYSLTPAALSALREMRTAPPKSDVMPMPQRFPISAAEVRSLAGGDGVTLKSVTVTPLADGGRRLQYKIRFDSLSAWNQSPAAVLFRAELVPAGDDVVELRCKGLGMDYLDWRLPRHEAGQMEQEFELLKQAAGKLDYRLRIQTPGEIAGGNAATVTENQAMWRWQGSETKLADVIGPDKALIRPQLRFATTDTRIKAPVFADLFIHIPAPSAEALTVSLDRCIIRQAAKVPGDGRHEDPITRRDVYLQMNVRAEGAVNPVGWTTPVYTELMLDDGDNLVVPMPPLFRIRTLRVDRRRSNRARFQVRSHFSSARDFEQIKQVRGSFLFWTAAAREEQQLPAPADWPDPGLLLKTPSGKPVLITKPEAGKIAVAGAADTLLEIDRVRIRSTGEDRLRVANWQHRGRRLRDANDELTMKTVYEFPPDSQPQISIRFFKGLKATRVPFLIRDLAAGTDDLPSVIIEDISDQDLRVLNLIADHNQGIRALSVSPDGRWIASAGRDAGIILRDLSKDSAHALPGHPEGVYALAFDATGKRLWSGGKDKTIRIWDVDQAAQTAILKGSNAGIRALAVDAEGTVLAAGTLESNLQIWRAADNAFKPAATLQGHQRGIRSAVMTPDGKHLLTGGLDRQVIFWNLDQQQPVHLMTGHKFPVRAVAMSADGKFGVSGADDMIIKLWDLQEGKQIREYKGHANLITSLVFLPDGKRFAAADMDGWIRIWALDAEEPVGEYKRDGDAVSALAVTRSGELIAGTRNGKILRFLLPAAP